MEGASPPFTHAGPEEAVSDHLQSPGLLQGGVAPQPGLIQSECSLLQLGQGGLDEGRGAVTRADQTQTEGLDGDHPLCSGIDLRLRGGQSQLHL